MTQLLKSFLTIAENPRTLPNFIFAYLVVTVIWHHEFLFTFATSASGFTQRLDLAFAAVDSFQYVAVFFLTLILFALKLLFNYLVKASREHVNEQEQKMKTTLVDVDTSKDMEHLISVLDNLKEQLKQAQENEKQAKMKAKEAISHLNSTQQKLDELAADFEVVNKENTKLREQVKSAKFIEQTE